MGCHSEVPPYYIWIAVGPCQLTCFRAGGYEFVASTLSGPARRSSIGRSNASARAFSVLSLGVCFPFSNRTNVIRPSPAACARFSWVSPAVSLSARTLAPRICLPSATISSILGR